MTPEFYKVMHILGLSLVLTALGGAALSAAKSKIPPILHGIGMVLILVSGFGMIAKYGYELASTPWLHVKLTLWVVVGALIALARRVPKAAAAVYIGGPVLVAFAAYSAIYKPF